VQDALAQHQLKAYEALLQACSHDSLGSGRQTITMQASPEQTVAVLRASKQASIESLQGQLKKRREQVANNAQAARIKNASGSMNLGEQMRWNLKNAGEREEILDQCTILGAKLAAVKNSLEYFERTLDDLRKGQVWLRDYNSLHLLWCAAFIALQLVPCPSFRRRLNAQSAWKRFRAPSAC
jgi:hypothetical protein